MTRRELGTLVALLVALAAVLGVALPAAHAALERVGPVVVGTGGHGYPGWYQDTTGLTLEFCNPLSQAELADGWCLLLPADTVAPEQFSAAFADEHFYWAADAGIDFTVNGVAGRARLVFLPAPQARSTSTASCRGVPPPSGRNAARPPARTR